MVITPACRVGDENSIFSSSAGCTHEGNYMNNDPEMVRWMYVEDSVFLQMKKQGYHRKV